MFINVKIHDDLNKQRKALKASWPQVIQAGLFTLKDSKDSLIIPNIKTNLKNAIQSLSLIWTSIKESESQHEPTQHHQSPNPPDAKSQL